MRDTGKGFAIGAAFITVVYMLSFANVAVRAQAPAEMRAAATAQQTSPAADFVPSEVQSLKLQLAQRELNLAQLAQQDALHQLVALGTQIRLENGWPATVQFNPYTLGYVSTVPPNPAAQNLPPAQKK